MTRLALGSTPAFAAFASESGDECRDAHASGCSEVGRTRLCRERSEFVLLGLAVGGARRGLNTRPLSAFSLLHARLKFFPPRPPTPALVRLTAQNTGPSVTMDPGPSSSVVFDPSPKDASITSLTAMATLLVGLCVCFCVRLAQPRAAACVDPAALEGALRRERPKAAVD